MQCVSLVLTALLTRVGLGPSAAEHIAALLQLSKLETAQPAFLYRLLRYNSAS